MDNAVDLNVAINPPGPHASRLPIPDDADDRPLVDKNLGRLIGGFAWNLIQEGQNGTAGINGGALRGLNRFNGLGRKPLEPTTIRVDEANGRGTSQELQDENADEAEQEIAVSSRHR